MISIQKLAQLVCVMAFLCASLFGQTVTSTLMGTLIDPASAVVPNAEVKVTDQATGAVRTVKSDEVGVFRFSSITAGAYTLEVKAQGFKAYQVKGVAVISSSTRDLGRIGLQIGALAEQVSVMAEATSVQVASSEKGALIDGDQLNKISLKGRDFIMLLAALPGITVGGQAGGSFNPETSSEDGIRQVSINGAPSGKANFLVDGVVDLDSGSYQTTHYEPNMDAIAEVRVLTAGYQAEYGRASGGTISLVTKGGGRDFHGSAWAIKRHEMFNANSWINNRDNVKKTPYRFFIAGFTVSGPAYIPKVFNKSRNKFFFFFSQEYTRQKPSTTTNYYLTPTALERAGDFSASLNSSGQLIPIKDPVTRQPFSENKINLALYDPSGLGRAMMNFFPLPNRCGASGATSDCWTETDATRLNSRNFRNQFTDSNPRRNDVLRFDANLTSKLSVFWRYINDYTVQQTSGNISLKGADGNWAPFSQDHPNPGHGYGIGITYAISPTMVNEFTFGKSYNTWDWYPHDPSMMDRARMNNPPHWFDENSPDFKNDGNLKRPGLSPGAQNFAFWVPAVSGGTVSQPYTGNNPYTNYNDIYQFSDNLSWLKRSHTLKAGFYYERTGKVQQAGGNYLGTYNFGSSSSFPYDTGYGNANMLIGNLQQYSEGARVMGDWWFTGMEAFVQDSWRIHKRLTLELGVRFYDLQPQINLNNTSAVYLPSAYDPTKAGRLWQPGCTVVTRPCPSASQVALDPVTGTTTFPALVNTFVLASVGGYSTAPDYFNGAQIAGVSTKIPAQLFTVPRFSPAFRAGLAWDVFGNGKTALRASIGQFFQRGDGNQIMGFGGAAPVVNGKNVYYTTVGAVQSSQNIAAFGPISNGGIVGSQKYESSMSTNFGIQQSVGFGTVVEGAFVGAYRRHGNQNRNLNPIALYSRYNPQYLDPWNAYANLSMPPTVSINDNNLRPLKGIGNVGTTTFDGSSNYSSFQGSVRRNMSHGTAFGLSYTFAKTTGASPSPYWPDKYRNYGATAIMNILSVNYVYEVPKVGQKLGFKPLGWVTDNWSISGIYAFVPWNMVGVSGINWGNTNTNNPAPELTGSAEGARLIVLRNPVFADSQSEYHYLDYTAFAPPSPCSWTNQSMACFGNAGAGNLIKIPVRTNNWDMTFRKEFPVFGEQRRISFQAEMYNIFNHTQISGINTTITYDVQKWRQGILAAPANDQFGRRTGARDPRRMAMTLRFEF